MVAPKVIRTSRAFTLVELLVVISIITLLMAIIMPSLGKSKAQAEKATCGTRLKGLTLAMRTYLSEFNDGFPINGLVLPKKGTPQMYLNDERFVKYSEPTPDKWRLEFGALWTYMGGGSLPPGYTMPLPLASETVRKGFICPVDLRNGLVRTYTGGVGDTNPTQPLHFSSDNPPRVLQGVGQPGYWSYSVNSVTNSLGRFRDRFAAGELPWSDPLRASTVKVPQFVVFIEEDDNSLFNDEVMDAPAYSQGDMLTGRHNNYGNVGYLDGSVEAWSKTVFNEVPSGIEGTYVDHRTAMASPITRMFFPDGGKFVPQ